MLLMDSSKKISFNRCIREGDLVIVYEKHDTMKAVKVCENSVLQNRFGVFKHLDWIGKPFGSKVFSNKGGFVYLLAPTPELWTLVLSHMTQILYIADIGFVVMYLEVVPGCLVLESGTGSGSLTTSFARAVAPTGHVYTFDFHEQRAASARLNLNSKSFSEFDSVSLVDPIPICNGMRGGKVVGCPQRQIPTTYIRAIHDMYCRSTTYVRTTIGNTETFPVEIGLHQRSALSPYIFALIMDDIYCATPEGVPWCMLFADDIVLVAKTKTELNSKLTTWKTTLEEKGLRINIEKTEYLCSNFSGNQNDEDVEVCIERHVLPSKDCFKYLRSMIHKDGGVDDDVTHRIKGKFYRMTIRAALQYGSECWAIKKDHVRRMEAAEMRMLRWACGRTLCDMTPNSAIRMRQPLDTVRRVESITVDGARRRGRSRRKWEDCLRSDLKDLTLTEDMTSDRKVDFKDLSCKYVHSVAEMLHSLEIIEDFEGTGISNLVTVGVRDIQGEGFPDEFSGLADSVFLDLPQPWLAIPSARNMLKQDGTLCSFSPCIEQVQRSCETLRSDFTDIRTFEILLRTYEVREWKMDHSKFEDGSSIAGPPCKRRQPSSEASVGDDTSFPAVVARPSAETRGHTGYLTFARRKCVS
ncbi:tRNA (adenine(58)-N(1))-methyltransferase catalytic subunit TRMT61A [Hibiscus syriacus]|uniref:tRNA (adenine(58)-N(1))-methyltransferase n=1 Tax=Hibiscus syriacus TaxID=106335 RepID=A0A6A2XB60_HIBSY|nr:tRNA (adenine(58)-N(1))-methyltransferase catalytic subunit TRMT61A [Hibiscus syriacus]